MALALARRFKLPRTYLVVEPLETRIDPDFDLIAPFSLTIETGGDVVGGAPHTDNQDPGGFTKFGISQRFNPDLDVAGLDQAAALRVLKERYWDPYGLGLVKNRLVQGVLFDFLMNAPGSALRAIYVIGNPAPSSDKKSPEVLADIINEAIDRLGAWTFIRDILSWRMDWIVKHARGKFIAGLMNRVSDLEMYLVWLADQLEKEGTTKCQHP